MIAKITLNIPGNIIKKDVSLEDKQRFREWLQKKLELRFPYAVIVVTNRHATNKLEVQGSDDDFRYYSHEVADYVEGCFAGCPWDWVRPFSSK